MLFKNRITVNPKVMGGTPCIRNTRIPVSIILKLLAKGETPEQLLTDYPELTEEDIRSCLEYASWSVSETSLPMET
ncbi:MAG: DUF433 domain-containing protein [Candidatus Heimdallarchaeota archaeon]